MGNILNNRMECPTCKKPMITMGSSKEKQLPDQSKISVTLFQCQVCGFSFEKPDNYSH